MIDNIKKNKKPLIIGLLLIAVFIFVFVTGGKTNKNNNMAAVASSEIEEATSTTQEISATSTTEDEQGEGENDDTNDETSYTGIGGGDQDILLQVSEETDASDQSESSEDNAIVTAGQNILDGMNTLSDEEFEELKPDLLALIAALEALIRDLENYIHYMETQQIA